jgi:hypothetical protein
VFTNTYIGLVPEAAPAGDRISIFMGGKTTFLIRSVGEKYQLLGTCYVHSIMYEEAMEELQK